MTDLSKCRLKGEKASDGIMFKFQERNKTAATVSAAINNAAASAALPAKRMEVLPSIIFKACNHRHNQIFLFEHSVRGDGGDMNGGKNGEQVEKVEMDFPHKAACMFGNQMVEVAVGAEGVFIGGKKPGADLK